MRMNCGVEPGTDDYTDYNQQSALENWIGMAHGPPCLDVNWMIERPYQAEFPSVGTIESFVSTALE